MMKCLALTYMMLLLNSVLATLPAPRNLSVVSFNFHHTLHWDPGPGTPPGTQYIIYRRLHGRNRSVQVNVTTATSIHLKLPATRKYKLIVQASFNQRRSPESTYIFCPYEDTKIGPPILSLAGCGDCIKINISLPEANILHKFYSPQFRILCRRGKETVGDYLTKEMNITIPNLNSGVEYCVQVHTKIIQNTNTEPSAWKCIFTSIIEPRRGAGAALLILVLGFLTAFVFCLHYTGFLCNLKVLPRALMTLSQGTFLTPEGTTPDPISIRSETVKQRRQNNPTIPLIAREDEEEEEEEEGEEGEEEINEYMDRDVQLSLGEGLCWSSSTVMEKNEPAESGDSGSLKERLLAAKPEFDGGGTHGGQEEDEAMAFIPEETQTEVQVGEEEQEAKRKQNNDVFEISSNVNLFSVTIAALSLGEEEENEEEQNERELLSNLVKQTDTQKQTLSNTDSETETEISVKYSHEDCTKTWNEDNHLDIKTSDTETQHEQVNEEKEDDEDDEDFSGYMAHT